MKNVTLPPPIDARRADDIWQTLAQRLPGYLPDWRPGERSAGQGLLHLTARQIETILQRLNQVPVKQKLAFLEAMGICLIPAQPARAPLVFQLSAAAADARAPVGTQVAAPPPPDSTQQVVFETENTIGLAAATLTDLVSLWPGRDQYIDHGAALAEGLPLRPFAMRDLKETPHYLYVAHNVLLALAGEVNLDVVVDLIQASSEHLGTIWEYWDGEVWRGFVADASGDGTDGWRRSGRFQLVSDCAEAKKTAVNGVEAFWLRARLDEPLPPEPAQTLPLVDGLELRSEMRRPLSVKLSATEPESPSDASQLTIVDGQETPIPALTLTTPDRVTDQEGRTLSSDPVAIQLFPEGLPETIAPSAGQTRIILDVAGLPPTAALIEETAADVSKPFYPFGVQPGPGSAFYFTHEEIFSKPGAQVQMYVQKAATPQEAFIVETEAPEPEAIAAAEAAGVALDETPTPTFLTHTVNWEYWNGRQWVMIDSFTNDATDPQAVNPKDFTGTGVVEFTVPEDMALTSVNGEEGVWLRVRLVSGGYGQRQVVTWNDGNGQTNTFSYVMPRPPALAVAVMGYTWQYGPFKPEQTFTYNDFQHEDHTEDARWPGHPFAPFAFLQDQTPALYLGFDKKLPVDRLGLLWQIVEDAADPRGPALLWEYWNGFNWRETAVRDETNHLRVPGIVSFIGARDSQSYARFGVDRHWLRARLKTDGPPGAPHIEKIYLNAVWAAQRQTVTNELLGVSNGRLNQQIQLRQYPILPDEQIEVRELEGARANVEWRILALELFAGDEAVLRRFEDQLRADGRETIIQEGDLRLVRDRDKRVTEVWVRWVGQPALDGSGPAERHYALDHTQGRLQFGNGVNGRIPAAGSLIRAIRFRAGGGAVGNVGVEQISQQLAGIGGVETVFNPLPAEGGADAETVDSVARRGPFTLRHRGRALAAVDYETMAYEASAAVAVAHAQPMRDGGRLERPGRITVTILPWSQEERPWPTFGLRQHVLNYVAAAPRPTSPPPLKSLSQGPITSWWM